jgi:hypothetical protein
MFGVFNFNRTNNLSKFMKRELQTKNPHRKGRDIIFDFPVYVLLSMFYNPIKQNGLSTLASWLMAHGFFLPS